MSTIKTPMSETALEALADDDTSDLLVESARSGKPEAIKLGDKTVYVVSAPKYGEYLKREKERRARER